MQVRIGLESDCGIRFVFLVMTNTSAYSMRKWKLLVLMYIARSKFKKLKEPP